MTSRLRASSRDLLVVAGVAVVFLLLAAVARQPGGDWSFFVDGGRTLGSSRWIHLYDDNPNSQTGPITFALAWLFGADGYPVVRLLLALIGLTMVIGLWFEVRDRPNALWRFVPGAAAFALWWPQMSKTGHLDDALVLAFGVLAACLALRGRPVGPGLLAGLALGVKPTGVALLPLAMPRDGHREWRRWVPLLVGLAVGGAVWAPWVLGNSSTLDRLKPLVPVLPDSTLGLLGMEGSAPTAVRAGQLLSVIAVGVWVMQRRGPSGVLLATAAVRLLLDTATWPYYTPAMVMGAFVWELFSTERKVPWCTLAVALLLPSRTYLDADTARAVLRTAVCLGSLVVVALPVPRGAGRPSPTAVLSS